MLLHWLLSSWYAPLILKENVKKYIHAAVFVYVHGIFYMYEVNNYYSLSICLSIDQAHYRWQKEMVGQIHFIYVKIQNYLSFT